MENVDKIFGEVEKTRGMLLSHMLGRKAFIHFQCIFIQCISHIEEFCILESTGEKPEMTLI